MKRLLVILLLIPILGFSQYTAIPDQNFEQRLIDLGYDNVIDGQVLTSNIDAITNLNVSIRNISDLTGIEDFTALTDLNCRYNSLNSLDVSNNTALTYLNCGNNSLTNLDLSLNTALTYLYCNENQLTSLDVSQNTALTTLSCIYNQLTSLDVSNNTALDVLWCPDNQLTSLDVSQNTALTSLDCGQNPLTSLDVSQNTALTTLRCPDNQLTSLDVSNNTALNGLFCSSNQLECLNLKNGNNNFMNIYCDINPYLNCIEVDDPTWATQNWTNIDSGVTFSSNCNYPAGCFINNIEEYQSNLSIYPNPTNNLIQIEIENHNGSSEAELYDFTGKLLEATNSTKLSLVDYPKGIYLLKVAYGDRIEEVKVVKE